MMAELRRLKRALLAAPANRAFVEHHRTRLSVSGRGLSEYDIDVKVFHLLVATREHQILAICFKAVVRFNRRCLGPAAYDALPVAARNCGAFVFDGQMTPLHGSADPRELVSAVNAELAARRVEYKVALKPNYGLQGKAVASVIEGRAALRKAIAAYPAVADAVVAARVALHISGGGSLTAAASVEEVPLTQALTDPYGGGDEALLDQELDHLEVCSTNLPEKP